MKENGSKLVGSGKGEAFSGNLAHHEDNKTVAKISILRKKPNNKQRAASQTSKQKP